MVASPMSSLRQLVAAFSLLNSIFVAACSALARADSRDSMVNTAFRAADAQSLRLGGTLESTLRMKCTMHRWHFALDSMESTVDTSPAHRSPAIQVNALETALDYASDELLPAAPVLLHALGDADYLAVPRNPRR